jgi:hypothetical protein
MQKVEIAFVGLMHTTARPKNSARASNHPLHWQDYTSVALMEF